MHPYDSDFYSRQERNSRSSALAVVPELLDLVKPSSVADVGCGTGTWLSVFRQLGVQDVQGFDGPWVDRKRLLIPQEQFRHADLQETLEFPRRFDLVTSFEVAEHLVESSAEGFVDGLVRLGDIIAFSAAVPYQGGDEHLNEQWPDYWAEKFHRRGYIALDILRRKLWKREDVLYWYKQNMLIYVREAVLKDHPRLLEAASTSQAYAFSIVHPTLYFARARDFVRMGVREATKLWFQVLVRSIQTRFKKWRQAMRRRPARPQPAEPRALIQT